MDPAPTWGLQTGPRATCESESAPFWDDVVGQGGAVGPLLILRVAKAPLLGQSQGEATQGTGYEGTS